MLHWIYFFIGVVIGIAGISIDRRFYHALHSLLFVIILMPLSIFVASSTGNTIGQGLVCALMVGLFVEMILTYQNPQAFNAHFKGGAKPLTEQEIRYGVVSFGLVTALVVGISVL